MVEKSCTISTCPLSRIYWLRSGSLCSIPRYRVASGPPSPTLHTPSMVASKTSPTPPLRRKTHVGISLSQLSAPFGAFSFLRRHTHRPSNDANLLCSSDNASQSSFIIAVTNAGIAVVPCIINGGFLTVASAWSAGRRRLLKGSRNLYGMVRSWHASKIFLRVKRFGVPYVAAVFLSAFLCSAYMTLSDSASTTILVPGV